MSEHDQSGLSLDAGQVDSANPGCVHHDFHGKKPSERRPKRRTKETDIPADAERLKRSGPIDRHVQTGSAAQKSDSVLFRLRQKTDTGLCAQTRAAQAGQVGFERVGKALERKSVHGLPQPPRTGESARRGRRDHRAERSKPTDVGRHRDSFAEHD